MMKFVIRSTVVLSLAAPALADPVAMAKRMNLEPGRYSVAEMMIIASEPNALASQRRIALIDRQNAREAERIARLLRTHGGAGGVVAFAPTR